MFNSTSRTFGVPHGTPERKPMASSARRQSVGSGNLFSGISQSGGGAASAKSRRPDAPAEPPCIAATAGMLERAVDKGNIDGGKCIIYEDVQCGVVSIVGWVVTEALDAVEPQFTFADGTTATALQVVIDFRSDFEAWLRSILRETVKVGARLRVIAHPHTVDNVLRLRAIHLSAASPAESSYYHILETIHTYLAATSQLNAPNSAHGLEKPLAELSLRSPPPKKLFAEQEQEEYKSVSPPPVELPANVKNVTDNCQRHVVRCILDGAKDDRGVAMTEITANLRRFFKVEVIREAVNCLDSKGDIFTSFPGWVDVCRLD